MDSLPCFLHEISERLLPCIHLDDSHGVHYLTHDTHALVGAVSGHQAQAGEHLTHPAWGTGTR